MTEDECRELAGFGAAPEIEFLGGHYKIREDGLAPLIRFARGAASGDPEAGTPLPVIYTFFADCIIDFAAFEAAAMAGRADMGDITPVLNQLVSWYCGRGHWPAMRLIGFVSGNFAELDGQLIRAGGRGLAALSAREACNVALAACLEGRSEDDRVIFLEDLEYEGDAASEALGMLRKMQAEQKAAAGG